MSNKTMDKERSDIIKDVLNKQKSHWNQTYDKEPEMFGEEPSKPARKAAALFEQEGKTKIIELGSGQGRDTIFFAKDGFQVTALEYAEEGIEAIKEKASALGLSHFVTVLSHDLRTHLPFADESFDACYSHMLFSIAFTTAELEFLFGEVRRVLKPAWLSVLSVRQTADSHYRTVDYRSEEICEVDGMIE